MKIVIKNSNLSLCTQRVQGALTEKALAQIGLKASQNKLELFATDRVIAIYSSEECLTKKEGECFVPAKFFSDVVKELPKGDVILEQQKTSLLIKSEGDSLFMIKIPILEGCLWQERPELEMKNKAQKFPAIKLAYMLEQVNFCIFQDSPRNYGTIGYLHKDVENKIKLVGTDGFRLSLCSLDLQTNDTFLKEGVCLSKRALNELLKMCHEGEENLEISVSKDSSTLLASIDNYQLYVLLSSVKYPNYQSVLPKKLGKTLCLSRGKLQSIVKRVLLAADKTKAVQLSFTKMRLTLSSKTLGSSEGREDIAIEGYNGEECKLGVNGKFLTDIFMHAVSDDMQLSFESEEQPLVFVPKEEPAGCLSQHVLVPIRDSE